MTTQAEEKVHHAFGAYLDHVVEELAEAGVPDETAVEILFQVADSLAEDGTLPAFPDDAQPWVEKARWLVAAADLDFMGFVREVMAGE